jgi:hypothetical protein
VLPRWISPLNIYAPPQDVPPRQRRIDEAATGSGRDPRALRRVYNVGYAHLVVAVDPAGETLRRWADVMAQAPHELSTAVMLSSQGTTASTWRASVLRQTGVFP